MALIENNVTLVKIGKIATPATAVLMGGVLVMSGPIFIGAIVILLGILAYVCVWTIVKEITITEWSAEKMRFKREKMRKDRVLTESNFAADKHRLEQEAMNRRMTEKIAKKIIDSI